MCRSLLAQIVCWRAKRDAFPVTPSPGQAVYEPFMGSGTTLIAAETTGRVCHDIELNPAYVDVAVERWQRFTGKVAVLDGDGRGFAELSDERRSNTNADTA